MTTIISDPSPDSPQPWFEFEFDGETFDLRECTGLAAFDCPADQRAEAKLKKVHKVSKQVGREDEVHVLAITLEGKVEFVPLSEQKPVYYAHLAWVHPDGKIDAITFQEDPSTLTEEVPADA